MTKSDQAITPVPATTRIAIETSSAIISAGSVAPFISIIDKAIFSNASGKEKLVPSLISGFKTLFTKPVVFFKQPSFLLIWGVYSGTYIVGNNVQGYYESCNASWQFPKFIGGSLANVTLSVLKDLYFTRAFGTGVAKPVPPASYTLYTIRDSITIFASFNLPSLLSSQLAESTGLSKPTAETVSQLVTPCAVQFLSSPLHLLGMDLYNRPSIASTLSVSKAERLSFIRREYVKTTAARIGRIFPAFGIGGVTNKSLRKALYARYQ